MQQNDRWLFSELLFFILVLHVIRIPSTGREAVRGPSDERSYPFSAQLVRRPTASSNGVDFVVSPVPARTRRYRRIGSSWRIRPFDRVRSVSIGGQTNAGTLVRQQSQAVVQLGVPKVRSADSQQSRRRRRQRRHRSESSRQLRLDESNPTDDADVRISKSRSA